MSCRTVAICFLIACSSDPTTTEIDSEIVTCVDLAATGDATISGSQPTKSFGSKKALQVGEGDESLVKFDLSSLPVGAAITTATMRVYVSHAKGTEPISIHRVKTSWNEATVTYQTFGQQFAAQAIGSLDVSIDNVLKSIDLTAQVQAWRSGAESNHGVLFERAATKDVTLVSHEGGTAAQRPRLQVCFTSTIDHCAPNPCEHGSCTNTANGFTCACEPGYSGTTCESNIDDCAGNPCQHGGACTDGVSGYTCSCPVGFTGTNCETDIDDCAGSPCLNGGICTDGVGSFTCACQAGFTGANCETAIDNCAANPCVHGSCANHTGGFTCECEPGYSGSACEIDNDDCAGNVCLNGGTCVDGVGSFTCVCPPDWGGPACEVNLNKCSQQPCLNGTCTSVPGGYTCECTDGYAGTNCEIDINDCAVNECQNESTCLDRVGGYTCVCQAGYTGTYCEWPPPPRPVRINGVCTAICVMHSDPDGDGWGWENNASCVTPDNPLTSSSPWCDSPEPQDAYEATNAHVDDSTTSVAQIPRPARITVGPKHDCPYDAADLLAWNPAWLAPDGTIMLPQNTRVLVHGGDLPATLIKHLYIPRTSELVFADEPMTIRIADLTIDGALRVGSATCRIESTIAFEFDTDENVGSASVRQAIYDRMGLGVMVGPNGVLDLFGHLNQPTWTRLASTAEAGATQISIAEAVDWQPGQQLVIATSARVDYPFADENEVRTIVSVSGTTVTIDQPLAYSHYGGPEYQVEVGLLSRNLKFRTSDRVRAAAPTFGGHIMVHSKHAHVSSVELYGLGQQNFLARYPFHWHRSGDLANASFFTDSSVWRSNYRCAVVHRTDRALVSRNVAFDNWGHCYYLEDGVEMNNEVSFNLAVRTKILGPVDATSLEVMRGHGQEGFVAMQSANLAQPADRAAAGFYITNGNNKIVGNATSGGFTGYSFPNLPRPTGGENPDRIFPVLYGASHFDGNTAHSAGYLWGEGGACIYIGGTLVEIGGQLQYTSGRTTVWELLRHKTEVFNNTKTFLCETGIVHWGNNPRIVNFESWDNGLMAKLFGSASIQSSLAVGKTDHVLPRLAGGSIYDLNRPVSWWNRGFQFYDTRTQTILSDVIFREFHHDPFSQSSSLREFDNCALLSMTHSDQFTPQSMNAVRGIHYANVDENQRLCISDRGTLSSRNFNVIDTDGSMTSLVDEFTGPRLIGSAWATSWQLNDDCVRHDGWGAMICALEAPQGVASIGTLPDADVRVTMYTLDNRILGENWYGHANEVDAQISGPSGTGWHHEFPNGVPATVDVQTLQVPVHSFVLLSFTLPPGVSCAIHDVGWTGVTDLPGLLASQAPAYTTAQNTCFVRVPPTAIGEFQASGVAVPNMTWRGNPTPTTYFAIDTGCAGNPACQTVVSAVPVIP